MLSIIIVSVLLENMDEMNERQKRRSERVKESAKVNAKEIAEENYTGVDYSLYSHHYDIPVFPISEEIITSGYVQVVEIEDSQDVNIYEVPSYEHLATPSYESQVVETSSQPDDSSSSNTYDSSPSYGDSNAGCDNSSSYDSCSGDC